MHALTDMGQKNPVAPGKMTCLNWFTNLAGSNDKHKVFLMSLTIS